MTHATLDCVIRLGQSQKLKGGISFEDCGPVFDGPLLSHSHALCTPGRLARILLKNSASSLDLAMGSQGRALPFARIFLPDFLDLRSIARLPRSTRGFYVLRHFGFQVAFALSRQRFP